MTVTVPNVSIEYLECSVTTDIVPTTLVVNFAFTQNDASPSSWSTGTWVGSAVQFGNLYQTRARTPLLGTGGLDLAVGEWLVWIQVVSSPEVPAIIVGKLVIT